MGQSHPTSSGVELCCIGAIAEYLQFHIDCTREFVDMTIEDWLTNSAWFAIKFLTDINSPDNTKEMSSNTYSEHVKKVLKRLNLPTNKLCHLGRVGLEPKEPCSHTTDAILKVV